MHSQNVFKKGSVMFNAGVGAPTAYGFIPTVNFSGEIGVIPTGSIGVISFGGLAEFHLADDGKTFPRFYVGGRAAWHVLTLKSKQWDAYAGAGFGIVLNGDGKSNNGSVLNPDFFIGGRYMFQPSLGLFSELGYSGLSVLRFGLTFGF